MAIGASILRGEIRRHLLMNVGLVASCVVGATVVTNERGLFVPITVDMSDTSRAFAAMFTQSHLLPDHEITSVQMVTPLAPFEVTADSRDLRRRLMDALATSNDPTSAGGGVPGTPSEFSQNASQLPTLDNQVLSLNNGGYGTPPAGGTSGGSGGGNSGGGGTQSASAAAPAAATGPTVASSTGTPTTASSTAATPTSTSTPVTTNSTQPLTVASSSNNAAQQQAASGVSDGTALSTDGGATSLGNSTGTDQTGPAAVPEPSVWAMLISGFGMIGFLLRSGRKRDEKGEAEATA